MNKNQIQLLIDTYYKSEDKSEKLEGAQFAEEQGLMGDASKLYCEAFSDIQNKEEALELAKAAKENGQDAKAAGLYLNAINAGADCIEDFIEAVPSKELIDHYAEIAMNLAVERVNDLFDDFDHYGAHPVDSYPENVLKLEINWGKKYDRVFKQFSYDLIKTAGKEDEYRQKIKNECREIIDKKIEHRGEYERFSVQAASCAEFAGFYKEAIELWNKVTIWGTIDDVVRVGQKAGMSEEEIIDLNKQTIARKQATDPNYLASIAEKLGRKDLAIFVSIDSKGGEEGLLHHILYRKGDNELNKSLKSAYAALSPEVQQDVQDKLVEKKQYLGAAFLGNEECIQKTIEKYKLQAKANKESPEEVSDGDATPLDVAFRVANLFNQYEEIFNLGIEFDKLDDAVKIIPKEEMNESLTDKIIETYVEKGEAAKAFDFIKKHELLDNYEINIKKR